MFRVWGKIISENHLKKEFVAEVDLPGSTRTKRVFTAMDQITEALDLSTPIWLDVNIREFQKRSKTRFTADSFIEPIDFDYLEFAVIEE